MPAAGSRPGSVPKGGWTDGTGLGDTDGRDTARFWAGIRAAEEEAAGSLRGQEPTLLAASLGRDGTGLSGVLRDVPFMGRPSRRQAPGELVRDGAFPESNWELLLWAEERAKLVINSFYFQEQPFLQEK